MVIDLDAVIISTDLAAERLYRDAAAAGIKLERRRVKSVSDGVVEAEGA